MRITDADESPTNISPSGTPRYRQFVGRRDGYDVMGGLQFSLLLALGIREQHTLCDVGCGSLRAGRLLIPYLESGNYCGIEPEQWLIDEALQHEIGADLVALRKPRFDNGTDFGLTRFDTPFDFALAQSVFSHTYKDLAATGLANIADALAPQGLLVGTFFERFPVVLPKGNSHDPEGGSGWRYPGTVSFTWREWSALAQEAGLVVRRVRWAHLRQTWFVAARPGAQAHLSHATRGINRTLRGPGALGHAWRRFGKRARHA